MSGFIQKAACKGHRPSTFAGYSAYQRPDLISALLRERHVARFVVAPEGYGKTSLVVEYAETTFGWDHTFWINAKSPCFLRDLDEGTIVADCRLADHKIKLAVFDDLPALDAQRAQAFSDVIDEFLDLEVEVVSIMTPACDVFGKLQIDRFCMGARDLVLSDEELDAARIFEERARLSSADIPESQRVPALIWGNDADRESRFIGRVVKERVPADMLLFACSVMVVQQGTLQDLKAVGSFDPDVIAEFASSYPHLGYDPDTRRFECCPFSIDAMANPFRGIMELLAQQSSCGSREELSYAWAAILANVRKNCARACDVIRAICPHAGRGPWLIDHAVDIVRNGAFYEGVRFALALKNRANELTVQDTSKRVAFESVCKMVLGDQAGAAQCAKRFAFDADAPVGVAVCCLYVLMRTGNDTLRVRALDAVCAIAERYADRPIGQLRPWEVLALGWMYASQGVEELLVFWVGAHNEAADDDVLYLMASWLFDAIASRHDDADSWCDLTGKDIAPVEQFVVDGATREGGLSNYFIVSAALSMEAVRVQDSECFTQQLPAGVMYALRKRESAMVEQCGLYERDCTVDLVRQSNWSATHPDSLSRKSSKPVTAVSQRAVPTLTLKLFGSFSVAIGDDYVDQRLFRRQHVRSLLVYLALNQGKEVSRDAIVHALWPNSTESMGRKNFYTIWGLLKRALALPDGTCPYLIKRQYGCSLDVHYVKSDVMRLNEICRELMFGRPDYQAWSELSIELERDFSSDLMPSVAQSGLVIEARNEYRSRLVDALIAAAQTILDSGNSQWALWFARTALGHDDLREDAYVFLMKSQIACNQRTAAMMTYLKCQRVLAEKLGVDPSPATTALYQELLETL